MTILIIGNQIVDSIADTIRKKYLTIEVVTATSLVNAKETIDRSVAIDRVIIFDNLLLATVDIGNTDKLRDATQKLINMLKTSTDCEFIAIAQSRVTGQLFLEELFEISYKAVVMLVGNSLKMATLLEYAIQSIPKLRQSPSLYKQDQSIYQQDDSIIWSDNKLIMSEWQSIDLTSKDFNFANRFRISLALELLDFVVSVALWEYKEVIVAQQANNIVQQYTQPKEIEQRAEKPVKKKGFLARLFEKLFKRKRKEEAV